MKSRAARNLATVGVLAVLLAFPTTLFADDGEGSDPEPQSGTARAPDIAEVFAPTLQKGSPTPLNAPYTLLTPIQHLLSGSVWIDATGQGPRSAGALSSRTRSNGPAPGLAWGSLREVFTAPAAPPAAPAAQGAGLVPFRDPAPSFSRNILITRDFSAATFQTEPSIAVNPNDPDHLILGTIDYNFPNVSSYVSIDGGVTWEGPFLPNYLKDDLGSGGDPVVAFDRDGNAYMIFISIGTEEYTVGPAAGIGVVSSIGITRSEDGGRTWSEPVSSARSGIESNLASDETGRVTGDITLSFLDKPWLSIGPDPENPSNDVIYITYTEFLERFSVFRIGDLPFFGVPILETVIRLVRSNDGGKSWSEPINVSPVVRRIFGATSSEPDDEGAAGAPLQEPSSGPAGTKRVVQGSQPAVAPDGTLFVAWLDSTDDDSMEGLAEVYVARSDDGGKTLSTPVRTAAFNEPAFSPRKSFFRYWGSAFPQLTVGPKGEVYVVYTAVPPDSRNDDGDIYFVRSLDNGDTWSRPKALNADDTDRLQFFPSITADPDGNVHVMWGDMRDDRADTRYHIYYTRSEDQGETWGFTDDTLDVHSADARVTDFPSNPNKGFPGGRFIGDYFSIASAKDEVYMVWADTRLGEFGPLNQKIGFARRTAIKSPEVFLNPPAGPGGQPVTLQGFNFQPDITVFISVGGVIVSSERTNLDGRFTSQVFVPISGEGAHAVSVFDDSGNRATSSFFMEFGFDNIQSTQDELAKRIDSLERGIGSIEGGVSDTVREEIARLQAALERAAPPPAAPPPAPEDSDSDDGGAPWWLLVAGIVAASAATAGVTAVLVRRIGPRGAPPDRWESAS